MYAAQWNTQVTSLNACSMADGSQISPTMLTIFVASEWSRKFSEKKKTNFGRRLVKQSYRFRVGLILQFKCLFT